MSEVLKLYATRNGAGNPSAVVRRPKVLKALGGISASTLDRLIWKGVFPKPMKIGFRAVGWLQSDIDNYLAKLDEQRKGA